jgi:hypothetical protein
MGVGEDRSQTERCSGVIPEAAGFRLEDAGERNYCGCLLGLDSAGTASVCEGSFDSAHRRLSDRA